jgi:hypothetical protein
MGDYSVCISPHYTTYLHTVFCFSAPSFCPVRNYFIVFEMCQEILTRYVHLLLQSEPNGSYFTTFFLLHCAPYSTQYTHYRLKHILPLHSNNFNDVFLLIISTKTVTLAWFRHKLPDDGPNGPKHVGAI